MLTRSNVPEITLVLNRLLEEVRHHRAISLGTNTAIALGSVIFF